MKTVIALGMSLLGGCLALGAHAALQSSSFEEEGAPLQIHVRGVKPLVSDSMSASISLGGPKPSVAVNSHPEGLFPLVDYSLQRKAVPSNSFLSKHGQYFKTWFERESSKISVPPQALKLARSPLEVPESFVFVGRGLGQNSLYSTLIFQETPEILGYRAPVLAGLFLLACGGGFL